MKSSVLNSDTSTYEKVNPLFICLGFPKCATTWIHRQLESHPEVGCTNTKEINYWTRNYSKGIEWYLNHFPMDKHYKIYAEVTPHYVNELALSRMAANLKNIDVRFMVCLRNPYDRSYSHFHDVVRAGRAKNNLEDAIKSTPEIIDQSLYAKNLNIFSNFFSLDKLYIDYYENIKLDPTGFIHRMYDFIGVDPTYTPPGLEKKVNPGRKSSRFSILYHKIRMFFRNKGLKREHLLKFGIWSFIESFEESLSRRRPIPKMTKDEACLIGSYLKEDLNKLESLINDGIVEQWKQLYISSR